MDKPEYLRAQRDFWNVDERTARMGRVDTFSRSDAEYERLADRDIQSVLDGVPQLGGTILEIGCGVGRLLICMHKRFPGAKLVGVDISENMIRYCSAAAPFAELHVNSGSDLGAIASNSIEFAYSNDVFIHIAEPNVVASYLSEICRVLKPGGLFRFNVRRFELSKMFSNSLGGLIGKALYAARLRSPMQSAGEGFSGLHYRRSDVGHFVRSAGLAPLNIRTAAGDDQHGRLWITVERPAA